MNNTMPFNLFSNNTGMTNSMPGQNWNGNMLENKIMNIERQLNMLEKRIDRIEGKQTPMPYTNAPINNEYNNHYGHDNYMI